VDNYIKGHFYHQIDHERSLLDDMNKVLNKQTINEIPFFVIEADKVIV